MKRMLKWALILCLVATPAWAAWNIQQKSNSGTVWTNQIGTQTGVGGGSHLQVTVDMSTANTKFVLTHRGGVIRRAYMMLNTAFTNSANPSITLWTLQSTTGFNPTHATQVSHTNGWTLTMSTGTAGNVFHLSTAPTSGHMLLNTANVIGIVPAAAMNCGGAGADSDTIYDCSVNVIIVIE